VRRERGEVPPIVPDGTAAVLLLGYVVPPARGGRSTPTSSPRPQARAITRNRCGAQAFVVSDLVGVQLHPKVRPATLDDWLGRFPVMAEVARAGRAALVEQARREDETRGGASGLVDAFAEVTSIRSGVPARDAAQPSWAASRRTSP
jgi:hypothetical protein